MVTRNQAKLIRSLEDIQHFIDPNSGRFYYLKDTGARRYVPHGPIATLIDYGWVESTSDTFGAFRIIRPTKVGLLMANLQPGKLHKR